MAMPERRRPFHAPTGPRVDDGLFGPGSVVWKVWSSASMYVAAYRSVIVQMLLPQVAHGVASSSDFSTDPLGRLRRTSHYFAAVALADTRTCEQVARQVRAMHGRVAGIEPITGTSYRALDQELLLYVHVTGWHSAIQCYERFNEPLSRRERMAYYEAGATGTELAGLDPRRVPTSPGAMRAYFEELAPHLAYGEAAAEVLDWMRTPRLPRNLRHLSPAIHLLRAGATATLPRHVARLSGFEQSATASAAATLALRGAVRALDTEPIGRFQRQVVPEAYDIVRSARERQAAWDAEHPLRRQRPVTRLATEARHLVAVP